MPGKLSFTQHAVAGVIVIAGGVGWIFALHQTQEIDILGNEVGRLTSVEDELVQVRRDLKTVQIERDRQQLQVEVETSKAESLQSEFEGCQAELETVQAKGQKQQDLLGDSTTWFKTKARARVRAGPSTDTDEVAVVSVGKTIQVFEIVEDGTWYKVGGMGYIFHELLEPIEKDMAE
jgi:peptidoglycan hydrolase CwlO-like protein